MLWFGNTRFELGERAVESGWLRRLRLAAGVEVGWGRLKPHQHPGPETLPRKLRNLVFENKPESGSVSQEGSHKPNPHKPAVYVKMTVYLAAMKCGGHVPRGNACLHEPSSSSPGRSLVKPECQRVSCLAHLVPLGQRDGPADTRRCPQPP